MLRRARDLDPTAVARIRAGRAEMDPAGWARARRDVGTSGIDWGYPFRAQCLFWEAVPAAEDAAKESPTDPGLAEALWAAAATHVFSGRLPASSAELLATPWQAAGLSL